MPLLVDTIEAQRWISQFTERPGDDQLARDLVGSLRLVSQNAFHQELSAVIRRAVTDLPSPLAVYAVRDIPDGQSYFIDKRSRPDAVGRGGEVGSEGVLANTATSLHRADPQRFLNHPSVSTLRRKRCHHLLLLDDLIGSGQTLEGFIRAMMRTDSIRSWWSYGWITFHVVAYASAEDGETLVRSAFRTLRSRHATTHIKFWYGHRPVVSSLMWPAATLTKMEAFCERYGKRAKVRWMYRKGFRDSMGMLVFAHGCPNNVPGIFWHTSDSWQPLFPSRVVPARLGIVFDQAGPLVQPSGLLTALEASTLATERVLSRLRPMERNMVLVLSALKKKIVRPDRLSLATNLPSRVVDEIIGTCLSYGYIDQNRQLTRHGVEELRAVSRLGSLPFDPPAFDGSFYFPKTLRAARE